MMAMSSGTASGAGALGNGGTSGSTGAGVELGATFICGSFGPSAEGSVGVGSGNGVAVAAIVGVVPDATVVGVSSATVATAAGSAVEHATRTSATSDTAMADSHSRDGPGMKALKLLCRRILRAMLNGMCVRFGIGL